MRRWRWVTEVEQRKWLRRLYRRRARRRPRPRDQGRGALAGGAPVWGSLEPRRGAQRCHRARTRMLSAPLAQNLLFYSVTRVLLDGSQGTHGSDAAGAVGALGAVGGASMARVQRTLVT